MREIVRTSQFKSDLKRLAKSSKYSIDELLSIVEKLALVRTGSHAELFR